MPEYEFTLAFTLPAQSDDPVGYEDALFEAGCDDALLGLGKMGRLKLQFNREAGTATDALLSALSNVRQAIPGATLLEAGPDWVGLTDIARLLGMTRQNIRKLMVSNAWSFPTPVHDGSTGLWHLYPVLVWFRDSKRQKVDAVLIETAKATLQLNVAQQTYWLEDSFTDRLAEVS